MDNKEIKANTIIRELSDNLLDHLSQVNNDLREHNAVLENKRKKIEQRKQALFNVLFENNKNNVALAYLKELQYVQEYWMNALTEGFQCVDKKNDAYMLAYKEWQEEATQRMQSQLNIDKFTFMEYHSIEAEINKLDIEYEETRNKIEEFNKIRNIENTQMIEKCSEYFNTIEAIEFLLRDIRREQENIMAAITVERRKQLFVKPSKEEDQLKFEIAMIELKIKQLEKLT